MQALAGKAKASKLTEGVSVCQGIREDLSLKQFLIGLQCLGAQLQKMSWEGMDREGYHSNSLDL